MPREKISIIIIHYNTPHYLQTCFDAILKQTYENIELIFIDNNSPNDEWKKTAEEFKEKFNENPARNFKIIANKENLGYAKAANQGIKMAIGNTAAEPARYVVITNPDIIYTPEYFEKIIARMEKDPKIAGITGKVYKYDFDKKMPTDIIDTVGLFAYRNRRIIDNGQGVIDTGQFSKEQEVFGISGACPLYRREALENVKIICERTARARNEANNLALPVVRRSELIKYEYFDEDFFMYKEDVDLSWRFLLYGWKNLYYPEAVAYHGRGTGVYQRFSAKQVFKNRKKLSQFQKKYSFTNQHLMQVKNETAKTFFKNFPSIFFKELFTLGYITIFEPYLWRSVINFFKKLPSALNKRKIIMRNKKISDKEMSKYFQKKPKYLQ